MREAADAGTEAGDEGFTVAEEWELSALLLVAELNRLPTSCWVIVTRPRRQLQSMAMPSDRYGNLPNGVGKIGWCRGDPVETSQSRNDGRADGALKKHGERQKDG